MGDFPVAVVRRAGPRRRHGGWNSAESRAIWELIDNS